MREVLDAIEVATRRVCDALDGIDLQAATELPGWTRLTVACHLRYGAEALRAMTVDALDGRPASYYPDGRGRQRPATLEPLDGESDGDVVMSLRAASEALATTWADVDDWSLVVVEPADNPDLGTVQLADLPLFRLTEVEVHGTDLGLGLPPWSDTLVRQVLPMRLERLSQRSVEGVGQGSFLLRAPDVGVSQLVAVEGTVLDRTIEASGRDLLALLLGRWDDGSVAARAFRLAFPGP